MSNLKYPDSMNTATVLIVDDDPLLGEQLRALIEVLGYRAKYCGTVAKALRAVEEAEPNVVFCDTWMPPHGGQAFYRQLVLGHPDLAEKVVFLVGGVLGDETQLFIRSTGRLQLVKPFKLPAVEQVLQQALDRGGVNLAGGCQPLQDQGEDKQEEEPNTQTQPC